MAGRGNSAGGRNMMGARVPTRAALAERLRCGLSARCALGRRPLGQASDRRVHAPAKRAALAGIASVNWLELRCRRRIWWLLRRGRRWLRAPRRAASLHVEHDVLRVPRRPPRPRLERRVNPVEGDAEPSRDGDQSDHVAKGVVAVRATKGAGAEPVSDDEARVVHPRQPERRRGPPNQRPEACGGGAAHQVVGVEAAEDVPPSERGVEELADKAGDKDDAGEGTEGEGMDGARSRQQPRNENLVADARAKLVLEFAGVALVEGALVDARPPPRVEALYVHPSGSARTVAGPEKRVGGGVGRVKANAAA
eukprot:CAMPEP_0202769594 /NCGR_PEP_ID=MMETSP1388-20130828/37027_1 /ASSEMBLY_ACC=CAM_ASM_000864 /TAXON_ID=37098 /ORGANISM="Isochrysis sp, Strain CCMP1244" /LENGTH=308 /DNA_ID=CAMNT_0049438383 /DNA_START=61 /DNA_END=984 /DNA_ORIENTATION=+